MFVAGPWVQRDRRLLTAISALAAVFSFVSYLVLFRHGSLNNDEVAYLRQARAIARGHLFVDVRQPAAAHRIWFFVQRSPGLVSKYLPFVSGIFALGFATVGSVAPVLAVLAGVLPWLVSGLAMEIGLGRTQALRAAALVSLSPLVLMESAIPLSYLPFLVALTASWWLLVRLAEGRAGVRSAMLLGLLATAAAGARPYDTVLLLLPVALWAGLRRRRDLPQLAGSVLLGVLPLGIFTALYDWAVSGRPWTPPFGLLEPSDTIGFGVRRLFPEETPTDFGPLQGLLGLGLHFVLGLLTWLALGLLLMPAAMVAWRRATAATRVLLLTVAVHLTGYWAFWGPYNFSWRWQKGTRVLGPIYAMPLVVPLVLAGLPVLARWRAARPRWFRPVWALGILVAIAQLTSAIGQAAVDRGRTDLLLAAARGAMAAGPLLFDTDPPYLGHPVSGLVDGISLSAATPVPDPGGPEPQLLQLPRLVYGTGTLAYSLTHEHRVEAAEVTLDVRLVREQGDVLVVERDGRSTACVLPYDQPVRVTLTPGGAAGCNGKAVPVEWDKQVYRRCPDASCVAFAVYRRADDGGSNRIAWRLMPVRTTATSVALLVDGAIVASSGDSWLRVTAA